MLTFLFVAQLAVAARSTTNADTATYATPALRTLIDEAVRVNNRVPPALGGYRATLESEISLGARDGAGHETVESIEEVASTLNWSRSGDFEQHVVGYRSQATGFQFATIGFFRNAWVIPSLYGNRLSLLFGVDTARHDKPKGDSTRWQKGLNAERRNTTTAIHPLSVERERIYRFAGGDTVERIRVGDREIRIVRVLVTPRANLPYRIVVFDGEVDLDADRKHIVRMRGSFEATADGPSGSFTGLLNTVRPVGIAFVELVNSEVAQEFWLPSYQRFEAQAMLPVMGDAKAVVRIVSHFHDYVITPPDRATIADMDADTLAARPHVLTIAGRDSISAFRAWHEEIGAATKPMSTEDFMDIAPPRWRADGVPELAVQAERLSDLIRFNRIEGLFTGLGVAGRPRGIVPGLTLRAVGGYAWNERTVRARTSAVLDRGDWSYALRAGRSLDITNDFRDPLDSGSTLGALIGSDDYDYVDRYSAGVAVTRTIPAAALQARLEAGWTDDRIVTNTLSSNPFRTEYLPNRGIDPGDYARTAFTLTWHPDANAEFMRPGFGAMLSYLRGDGQLNFQRVDFRLTGRRNAGAWTFATRFDAGVVFGSPPPQQLFEIGESEGLPGYSYKQFAGDQAALLRTLAMYRLPLLNAPIRLTHLYWLPPVAPALAFTVQAGWTGTSDAAARASVLRLGETAGAPVSTVTGNVRTTIGGGLRFFGGAVGVSVARAIDHADRWKAQLTFGDFF